jgi:hypothetical protein
MGWTHRAPLSVDMLSVGGRSSRHGGDVPDGVIIGDVMEMSKGGKRWEMEGCRLWVVCE